MILLPRALPLAKGTVRVIFFVKVIFCAAVSDVEIADGGQRRVAEGCSRSAARTEKIRQLPKFTVD